MGKRIGWAMMRRIDRTYLVEECTVPLSDDMRGSCYGRAAIAMIHEVRVMQRLARAAQETKYLTVG